RDKHVFTIAPTGSGKTFTFWLPLLFNNNGVLILITALNQLGDKNVQELEPLGITAINITSDNICEKIINDVANLVYQVVIVNPELLVNHKLFINLWKNKKFSSRVFNITFDEAHCICQWGESFCPDYKNLNLLKWRMPSNIRFHVASATMPKSYIKSIQSILQVEPANCTFIHLSNNRPNIHLMVEQIRNTAKSVYDLERVLLLDGDERGPPKFMIFCNKRSECEYIARHLRFKLGSDRCNKVAGDIWGIVCTDAAGMGLDISDVELVVQWKYTVSICTLVQRLGRGARHPSVEATGIYLVESQYFDETQERLRRAAEKHAQKRKGADQSAAASKPASKRRRTGAGPAGADINVDTETISDQEGDEAMVLGGEVVMDVDGVVPSCESGIPLSGGLSDDEYEKAMMSSRLCCDTCNTGSFILTQPHYPPPKSTRAPRKLTFPPYTMTHKENDLCEALKKWRDDQVKIEGLETNIYFGKQLILPDDILKRIVDLAHHFKLPNTQALHAQTGWCYASKYGSHILQYVHLHFPAPPTPVTQQPN
ncbi:hypothetical protein M378DRAFT_42222, partial [Amanita muscaria Koide BX008]